MLSRHADAVYWLNRYVERAENVARFVDVNNRLALELPQESEANWGALVTTSGDDADFAARYGEANRPNVIYFLTFDLQNPNSILSCLSHARENGRSIREVISTEMLERVNRTYLFIQRMANTPLERIDTQSFFQDIRMECHLFCGVMDATMSHGEPWHFGRMGRFLERADKTARLLDVKYYILLPAVEDIGSPIDDLQWDAVLRSASALEMYRKKYHGPVTPRNVVEFLVLAREFPRSVRYGIARAEQSLQAITDSPPGTFVNEAEKRMGKLNAELEFTDVKDILDLGLHEFIQNTQTRINHIGEGVQESLFGSRSVPEGINVL